MLMLSCSSLFIVRPCFCQCGVVCRRAAKPAIELETMISVTQQSEYFYDLKTFLKMLKMIKYL